MSPVLSRVGQKVIPWALGVLLLAELGGVWHRRAVAVEAVRRHQAVEVRRQELPPAVRGVLTDQRPALELSRRAGELWLEQTQRELMGAAPDPLLLGPEPLDRAAAYFELVRATDALVAAAQAASVRLLPGEMFGWASYAQGGPERDLIPEVHRQRRVIDRVVRLLFATEPRSLTGVQRERPRGSSNDAAATTGVAADFFVPDPRWRILDDRRVSSTLVRVNFEGDTQVLRRFLHALASSVPPLLVRALDVEPVPWETGGELGPTDAAGPTAVAPAWSRFAVTIEALERLAPGTATGGIP
jgi:hypothetical protein